MICPALHPGKLTCPPKRGHLKRKIDNIVFQPPFFRGQSFAFRGQRPQSFTWNLKMRVSKKGISLPVADFQGPC